MNMPTEYYEDQLSEAKKWRATFPDDLRTMTPRTEAILAAHPPTDSLEYAYEAMLDFARNLELALNKLNAVSDLMLTPHQLCPRKQTFDEWIEGKKFAPHHPEEARRQVNEVARVAWQASEQRFAGCSVTEVAANYPSVHEYIKSMEDRLARITNHYNIIRSDLVEREAKSLYGAFQAAACGKDTDHCRTLANARLRGKCEGCNGTGEVGGQFPDGSHQTDACHHCEGNGFVEIPELLNGTESGTHNK